MWFTSCLQADLRPCARVGARRSPGAVLHSSNEPSELWQPLCHNDSTINAVFDIINVIIAIIITNTFGCTMRLNDTLLWPLVVTSLRTIYICHLIRR